MSSEHYRQAAILAAFMEKVRSSGTTAAKR